ncbi:MAG: hypothetical protein JXR63_13845 [Spirochaetales bacterium]|nr:hypothetical protein [Spirochaetales bacterium]
MINSIKKLSLVLGLAVFMFSCTSYKIDRTDKTSELKSITDLTFDNKVNMNNIVDLGAVEATASVTETIEGKMITYKSEFFEITVDNGKKTVDFKEGSVFHNGIMTPLTSMSSTGNFALFFLPKKKEAPVFNARTLAQNTAEYFLLEAAKAKGATTVMLPQYSWDIKIEAEGEKFWVFDKVKSSTRTYTVKIIARAISFKPSETDNALSVKVQN